MARIFIPDEEVSSYLEALRVAVAFTKIYPRNAEQTKLLRRLSKQLKKGANEVGESVTPEDAVKNLVYAIFPSKLLKVEGIIPKVPLHQNEKIISIINNLRK